jgi:AbiV family abortive infection protein
MSKASKKKPTPVAAQYLLQGAVYALEQCGLLLRDANILYRSGSYASAVVLAAFAREELGRSTILHDLRKQALSGKEVTIEEIKDLCEHAAKQRAGMLSIIIRDPRIGQLIRAESNPDLPAEERQKVREGIDAIVERHREHTPWARYQDRMAALYVDPISEALWNRPATVSAADAQRFLQDAVNDYANPYHQRYLTPFGGREILQFVDPDLHAALEQWADRPELWPPAWPPVIEEA